MINIEKPIEIAKNMAIFNEPMMLLSDSNHYSMFLKGIKCYRNYFETSHILELKMKNLNNGHFRIENDHRWPNLLGPRRFNCFETLTIESAMLFPSWKVLVCKEMLRKIKVICHHGCILTHLFCANSGKKLTPNSANLRIP